MPALLAAGIGPVLAPLVRQAGLPLAVKELVSSAWVYANAPMAALLGRPLQDVLGATDAKIFDAVSAEALRVAEAAALARGDASSTELRLALAGVASEVCIAWVPVVAAQASAPTHLCSLWIDLGPQRRHKAQLALALAQLEEAQQANAALRRELSDGAMRDPATGLFTCAHFDDLLRRESDLSTREHREFALVSIALDPLSEELRARGEAAHARVLEALGRLLRGNTRAMDASCHLGNDNFAVLLSGVGLATAHSRMEGLRRQCATQIVAFAGEDLRFSVSMGVASFPHTAPTRDELLAACEAALAEAQSRGGNRVVLASIRLE